MKKTFIILAILGLIGYGLFESERLLRGPQISILSPQNMSATSSPTILIEGVAKNIAFLTINDRPAFADEEGYFKELLSPAAGYTVVTVRATDRFGRRVSESVSITKLDYCPAKLYG
jgi:hypothetical protein